MMEINREFWSTLFFTVLNILILYFILKKILFKPVSKYMLARTTKIEEALVLAEEAKSMASRMEEEHKERLKEIKEEGNALIASYEKKAKDEYQSIIAKAKEDSEKFAENTRNELEIEKEQLIVGLKEQISDLVLEASKKVINENLDTDSNRKLIDKFIKDEK